MPLNMTKIAFGAESAGSLRDWLESHHGEGEFGGEARLTTRYLPKRVAEMAGGSLYWILGGVLVGRSPLLGFAEKPDGKVWIRLEPKLIPVEARPRRAHQGWRYLEAADAPPDGSGEGGDALPPALAGELARLGLL
ncbi:MAG: DUF1489 domain-containing protein [Sphingobium sp.]